MTFLVVRGKSIVSFVCVAICLLVSGFIFSESAAAQSVFVGVKKKLPIYCVDTDEKVVALTFDAAWGADKTDDILALLKEYDAKATFFVVGFWADKYSDKLKMLSENGIEIGTHSNTHAHMPKLSKSQMELDLASSMDIIKQAAGIESIKVFRCPFGEYSDKLLEVTDALSLKTIQWDVDSLDWKNLSGREISERVLPRIKNGSIVLMHNDGKYIVEGLRLILEGVKAAGYKCVTVSDLVYADNYTIDHTGKQIKNKI